MSAPAISRSRRHLLLAGAAAGVSALAACVTPLVPVASTSPQRLRLLAEGRLAHRMAFQGSIVGGLSGIDFDPASGLWVALSDDRSEILPARLYTFAMDIVPGQRLQPRLRDAVTLRQAAGTPYPNRRAGGEVVDPEAIRFLPGGDRVLWASEGDVVAGQHPSVRESKLDGTFVREFETPKALRFGKPGTGPRSNDTFEGLALTPDARGVWAAMETALAQDGPTARVGVPGGPCRFTLFDVESGRAVRQIAYLPDSVPVAPMVPGGFVLNGVSEVLMIDARRMLVLERSYSLGRGMSIRIYEIDVEDASDTLALDRLVAGQYRPAPRKPVADFARLGLSTVDNTEGMCWGPALANGSRSLVFVSDDNFNPAQVTQFVACEFLDGA